MTRLEALMEARESLHSHATGGNDGAAEAEGVINKMIEQLIKHKARRGIRCKAMILALTGKGKPCRLAGEWSREIGPDGEQIRYDGKADK